MLRFRPPAPMVPQVAAVDFELSAGVVAPKGSLVIPSLLAPVYTDKSFPNAQARARPCARRRGRCPADGWAGCVRQAFDPDRMGPERKEDVHFAKHFLTFGCGPHACVGYQYAINHMIAFAARLSTQVQWERKHTAVSENLLYLPTIYPADCLLKIAPRTAAAK